MSEVLKLFLPPLLLSALISYLTTPIIIKFAKKLRIIDDPKKHIHPKVIHTYPIPRGGGIPIFIAITLSSLMFLPLDKYLLGIISACFMIALLGIMDDRYDLNPYLRLFFQFLIVLIPIAAGIGISFISNPFNGVFDLSNPQITFNFLGEQRSIWILSDLFALVWIITLMNFVNIGASGLDGQLSGTTAIASFTIALLSLRYSADITQWPVTILASITCGAYLGFLRWHIFPQKIMPGFGGATMAGFLLAILSILSTTKVGTLMVVLAIPLVDTGFTIIRRVLSGKSPFWGDRSHLHHKLLDMGWSKRGVAFFYWFTSGFLGFLALNLSATNKLYTIIGVAIFIAGLFLIYRQKQKHQWS